MRLPSAPSLATQSDTEAILAPRGVPARLHLHRRPNSWPKPTDEPLIHAATGEALEAIHAWESCGHLPNLNPSLLPQVFRNLSRHGYAPAADLETHYREALARNRAQFQRFAPLLRALHMQAIPTLLLNGVALSLATYRDPGARPVSDLHVLVPANEADRALEYFAEKGWRSVEGRRMGLSVPQLRYRHSMPLIGPTNERVFLSWHLLAQSRASQADQDFWQQAWPAYLDEDRSLVLAPTHQLLHTCAQSLNGDPQWAVDALITIRQSKIAWEALLPLAQLHDLVLPLADALAYLQQTYHAAIPRSLVWRLESLPVSRLAQMEYRRLTQPELNHGPLVRLAHAYRSYLRGVGDLPLRSQITGLAPYLIDRYQLPGAASLPRHLLSRLRRR